MEEMIYTSKKAIKILQSGIYQGYSYKVISYGTHPCCYVEIPKGNILFKKDYLQEELRGINCHGGITFSDFRDFGKGSKWYIGWDYNRLRDFNGIYLMPELQEFGHSKDKKWKTYELVQDCKKVIEQLNKEQSND